MPDLSLIKLRLRPLTNVFVDCRHGRYLEKPVLTTPETHNIMFTIAAVDFKAFSVWLPNAGAAISGVKVQACLSSAWGSDSVMPLVPPGGVWENLTRNGSTSITLDASPASEIVEFTKLDWKGKNSLARTDGGANANALICIRIQFPTGSRPSLPANNLYYTRISGQNWNPHKVCFQGAAGIDTPSSLTDTATVNEGGYMPAIQFMSSKWGRQAYMCGDSIMEGLGPNCRGMAAPQRACFLLATNEKPYVFFNGGQHAQSPKTYTVSLAKHIPFVKPQVVVLAPASGNNTFAPAGLDTLTLEEDYLGIARVSQALAALENPPVFLMTEFPPSLYVYKAFGANDIFRQNFNTSLQGYGRDPVTVPATTVNGQVLKEITMNRVGVTPVVGYSAAISQATARPDGQFEPKTDAISSSDNTHPNEVGVTRDLCPAIISYMEAV